MKKKYPIFKEFFPFNHFSAPSGRFFLRLAKAFMKMPRWFKKDKDIDFKTIVLKGHQGEDFRLHLLSPKGKEGKLPLLYFIHGGGFIFESSNAHYRMALTFAKRLHIKVAYLQYNLAPACPFPYPQEEAFAAAKYLVEHAGELGIDETKIGCMGDSAGGTLCVSSTILSHIRRVEFKPTFLLLLYPWLDNRGTSKSSQEYTDTPMWSSKKSKNAGRFTNPEHIPYPPEFTSPSQYEDLSFLPDAYIETAEFDPLHDDGELFASLLRKEGKQVEYQEVKGTMHGYDTKWKAPTVQRQMEKRLEYVSKRFGLVLD